MTAMTLNVRVKGDLGQHVADAVSDDGLYDNASEYVRDLIRRDFERREQERFETLKAELQRAFSVPDGECIPFDADGFRARMRQRYG